MSKSLIDYEGEIAKTVQQILDSTDYMGVNGVDMSKITVFMAACRRYIMLFPKIQGTAGGKYGLSGHNLEFSINDVQRMLSDAEKTWEKYGDVTSNKKPPKSLTTTSQYGAGWHPGY